MTRRGRLAALALVPGIGLAAGGVAVVGDGVRRTPEVTATPVAARATTCAVPPRVPGRLPARWKDRSTAVGPVYLYKIEEYARLDPDDFRPLEGTGGKRFRPEKQLVLVRGGPVTLSIARAQRKVASLLYDDVPFANGYAISDGTPTVTFGDCGVAVSQWSGAFIVAGARCVDLTARDASGDVVGRRRIGFGRSGC
jgi:hypothetical protein